MDIIDLVIFALWLGVPVTVVLAAAVAHRGLYAGVDMSIKKPHELLAGTLERLGAERVSGRSPMRWKLDHRGSRWEISYSKGGEGPSAVSIHRVLPLSDADDARDRHLGLRFSAETPLQRWGRRLGINRELQIGDDAFDDAVYVESDPGDNAAAQALTDPELRASVRALIATGCMRAGTDLGHGPLCGVWLQHPDWGEPEKIVSWLDLLDRFAARLPPARARPRPRGWPKRGLAIAALGIVSAIGAMACWAAASTIWHPLESGLVVPGAVVFAALMAATAALGFALTRGRPSGLTEFVGVVCAGWLTHIATAAALVLCWNGAGDPTVEAHSVSVIDREVIEGDGGHLNWRLILAPPPRISEPLRLPVSQALYDSDPIGLTCTLRSGQGRLDVPWKESLTCPDPHEPAP